MVLPLGPLSPRDLERLRQLSLRPRPAAWAAEEAKPTAASPEEARPRVAKPSTAPETAEPPADSSAEQLTAKPAAEPRPADTADVQHAARSLAEIKAAAKAGDPLTPEDQERIIHDVEEASEHFAAKAERGLPTIDITGRTTEDLAPAAWAALKRVNKPERVFVRGASMTSIDTDENGVPMVRDVMAPRLRLELGRCARWWRRVGKEMVQGDPPGSVVSNMLADPAQPLPPLRRLVSAPVLAPGGSIVSPGYHDSGIYYFNADRLDVPTVSPTPTDAEVARARGIILDDLLGDFPFVDDSARAHTLALMLLPFVRSLINGATPLHLIEKPSPGTGAGLLVTVATIPVLGRGAAIMTAGHDEDEWRKRLTSVLMGMPAVVLIDNLREPLDSAAVSAVLTATEWEDRILGQSKMVRVPVQCAWVATGNNPSLSNEIARRCISIRLDPKQDRPWMRTGFKHENLTEWALTNRGALVWALLTLVRRWISAGRPQGKKALGTFEVWARTLGGILDSVGVLGFLGNLAAFYERADTEGESWRGFVENWWDRFGREPVAAGDLMSTLWDASGQGPLELRGNTDRARLTYLGRALGKYAGRVFERWSVERDGGPRRGVQHWRLNLAREVPE